VRKVRREYRCLMEIGFDNFNVETPAVLSAPLIAKLADPDWVSNLTNRCGTEGVDLAVCGCVVTPKPCTTTSSSAATPAMAGSSRAGMCTSQTLNTEISPSTTRITVDNRPGAASAFSTVSSVRARAGRAAALRPVTASTPTRPSLRDERCTAENISSNAGPRCLCLPL
jgi:hypothetical protein